MKHIVIRQMLVLKKTKVATKLMKILLFSSRFELNEPAMGHGLMLSLSIAKRRNLLNSQSPVYVGDRQAPPDLLNLLPEGTDSDPDVWLTHHKSIPALPDLGWMANLK